MSNEYLIGQTLQAIWGMIEVFERSAKELRRIHAAMSKENDLTYTSEAMQVVFNAIANCRLDLFASRPIRSLLEKDKKGNS